MTATAKNIAAAAIAAAGFTPSDHPADSFIHGGNLHAFSKEHAGTGNQANPAFHVVVEIATGKVVRAH